MTHYDFDQLHNRRASDSDKWNKYPQDVLPLWVADMDFVSPEPVLRALHHRVDHGIFGYPTNPNSLASDISDLRNTVLDRLWRLYKWRVEPQEILILPGVITGLHLSCYSVASPPDAILVQTPVYPPILNAARTTGLTGQEMELTRQPDGAYSVDWDAFEKGFLPDTRLFMFCNPHNPVGKVFQRHELERLAEICLQKGAVICSDEIHCDIVFRGHRHVPIAVLDNEITQNTITLMAPSKTFNMAGLKCSMAIIQNKDLRKRFIKTQKGLVPAVNLMGLVAAQTAYREGQEWLDQLLAYLEANRDYLVNYVRDNLPGVEMGAPEGTYLAWLDFRKTGIQSPYQFLLDQARVGLNDGVTFGRGGEGFVRLNFACPRSLLEQALERIKLAQNMHQVET